MLAQSLREMERDGLIIRTDLSGRLRHVEYSLSDSGGLAVLQLINRIPISPLVILRLSATAKGTIHIKYVVTPEFSAEDVLASNSLIVLSPADGLG
jgi:hypothetical protein